MQNQDIITDKPSFSNPCFSLMNRVKRASWNTVCALFFRTSPRPFHSWRAMLLKLFGATLGPECHVYPKAVIWAPWNLVCEDHVGIADGAIIYNPDTVRIGSHAVISQESYLCGATHDYDDPCFPLVAKPITIEPYAWVCARATVQLGVTVGEGTVLALGSVTTRNAEPWSIYAGVPSKKIKDRKRPAEAAKSNF